MRCNGQIQLTTGQSLPKTRAVEDFAVVPLRRMRLHAHTETYNLHLLLPQAG